MRGPLHGIRVADFSHVMAGPYCTMTLADMGAEVIKIESPQGDPTRGLMSPGEGRESPFFLCLNRNKQSIVLDLQSEGGRRVAMDIIAGADVLTENFGTGVMKRLGFDYESLAAKHPRLVYCSVSAYGRQGAFADRAGYDPIVQAESGLMYLNGHAGGEPYKTAIPIIDLGTGMYAAQAVLAALYAREHTGRGQFIDVPLFNCAVSLTSYHTMSFLTGGEDPKRQGNSSPAAGPVGLFHAKDGSFFMTVAGERVWHKLVAALGRPAVLSDAKFATNRLRVRHQPELDHALGQLFGQRTRDEWMDTLRDAGVPVGPVRTIGEAVRSPEMAASGAIVEAPHRSLGSVPNLRLPMSMSDTPLEVHHGAPLLGEHTRQVLSGVLGYGADEIAKLLASGAAVALAAETGA